MDNAMQRSDSVDQAASGVQHPEASRVHVTVLTSTAQREYRQATNKCSTRL